EFSIDVGKLTVQAQAMIDPSNPNGGTVSVDQPLSPIKGTAAVITPGALPAGNAVQISIASIDNAPIPASAVLSGISASSLKAVEFGPTGLGFVKPIDIYVPVTDEVLAKGDPEVQTYDYATGNWEQATVVAIDRVNHFVIAEAQHFSTYVAT